MYTIPVGQGDGTVIQCNDGDLSILDMGQISGNGLVGKDNLLENLGVEKGSRGKLLSEDNICKLKKIFLTHNDRDHTSFIPNILEHFKENCGPMRLNIYIGGYKETYSTATKQYFKYHDVWEAKADRRNAGKTCGYIRNGFHECIWHNGGTQSDKVVRLCQDNDWALTLMAANYGEFFRSSDQGTTDNKNSLVMKLTPYDKHKPSMLFLGDFEGEESYEALYEAAQRYKSEYTRKKQKTKLHPTLAEGLVSDVVMVPHHGSGSNGNGDRTFYDKVQANHYIISSDPLSRNGHPRCEVVDSIRSYIETKIPKNTIGDESIWCLNGKVTMNSIKDTKIIEKKDYTTDGKYLIYQTLSPNDALTGYDAQSIITLMNRKTGAITLSLDELDDI